jgi:hypothetical protein
VSLTSELADPRSPLTIWLRGQLPNRAPAAGHLAAALQGAPTLTRRRRAAATRGRPSAAPLGTAWRSRSPLYPRTPRCWARPG